MGLSRADGETLAGVLDEAISRVAHLRPSHSAPLGSILALASGGYSVTPRTPAGEDTISRKCQQGEEVRPSCDLLQPSRDCLSPGVARLQWGPGECVLPPSVLAGNKLLANTFRLMVY